MRNSGIAYTLVRPGGLTDDKGGISQLIISCALCLRSTPPTAAGLLCMRRGPHSYPNRRPLLTNARAHNPSAQHPACLRIVAGTLTQQRQMNAHAYRLAHLAPWPCQLARRMAAG